MIGVKDYLLIQYKRIFKLLPGMICMIALVAILLSAALYGVLNNEKYKSEQIRYKLGLVGGTENEMVDLGVHMLETEDDMQYVLDLVQFDDEDEARVALRNADISAYIVITKEFTDAVDTMTNDAKLKYYATSGQKGISNVMMDEIALVATNIIVPSEKGICTLRDVMAEEGYEKTETYMAVYEIFMAYVNTMLLRGEISTVTELGISDGLNTIEYYFISMLLFFALLLTMCSVSFFTGKNNGQYKFLAAKGITPVQQVMGEFIPLLTVNLISIVVVLVIANAAVKLVAIDIEISAMLVAGIMLSTVMFTSMGYFLYETLVGVINKVLVTFLFYIAGAYASGYFYPKSILPNLLQRAGELIPAGAAFSYVGGVVADRNFGWPVIAMAVYTVGFIAISVLIRKRRISW